MCNMPASSVLQQSKVKRLAKFSSILALLYCLKQQRQRNIALLTKTSLCTRIAFDEIKKRDKNRGQRGLRGLANIRTSFQNFRFIFINKNKAISLGWCTTQKFKPYITFFLLDRRRNTRSSFLFVFVHLFIYLYSYNILRNIPLAGFLRTHLGAQEMLLVSRAILRQKKKKKKKEKKRQRKRKNIQRSVGATM